MSSKLKPLDLTGAVVGFTGTIDFNQFTKFAPNNMTQKAHVWLFNESGCGLDVTFLASNNSHYLPAGGWGTFDLEPNDGQVFVSVTYTLPDPPVSSLNAIYYAPGEVVPQAFTLGNSPIGIGGSVSVSSVQTLSNEGNAANLLVVDIGDVANAQLIKFYTDHFVLSVDQSGVAHQVLKGQTVGNALLLGQLGDVTEVLGQLLVDQVSNFTGVLNANGGLNTNTLREDTNGNVVADLSGGVGNIDFKQIATFDAAPNITGGILDLRGSAILNYTGTNTHLSVPTAAAIALDVNSITIGTVDGTGITGSNLISSGAITLGTGQLNVTDGKIKHFNGASSACATTGTNISHGLSTTPRIVHGMPGITQSGSATSGVGNIGATTFEATIGNGTLLLWTAWHE